MKLKIITDKFTISIGLGWIFLAAGILLGGIKGALVSLAMVAAFSILGSLNDR